MRKTRKSRGQRGKMSADQIARRADRGEDISRFFTNTGRIMAPIQRVNVDFTREMLDELDEEARRLNVSRQAVIKTFVREGLDKRHLAESARKS